MSALDLSLDQQTQGIVS